MKRKSTLIFIIFGLIALPFTCLPQAGTLDVTYGDEGIVILGPTTSHELANDLLILSDTSVIICGSAMFSGSFDGFLMRIDPNGSQDMTFGGDGIVEISYGAETYPYSMKLQPDGKIVVAGTTYPTVSNAEFFVARYFQDGTPDLTFNSTGYFIGSYSTEDEIVNSVAIQSDQKLVFAGRTYAGDYSQLLFGRLNPDGTLDNSFGTNGYTEINSSIQDEQINSVKLMNNGTIIGVGYGYQGSPMWSEQAVMAKLTSAGAPAPGFGTNGVLIPSVFNDVSVAYDLVIMNDSIFITGDMYDASNNRQLFITKLDPSGNAYSGFGTSGISFLYLNPLNVGLAMLRTVDGKIYISGTTGQGGTGNRDFLLARYLPSGDLDEDFDSDGYTTTPIRPDWDEANAIGMQPDGKLVLAGVTSGFSTTGNNDIAMTRYLNDYMPSGLYANFNANSTLVCEGSTVQYTDISLSTDSIVLTWNWTFEGGSPASSAVQNPSVTYNNDGVYDVRLIVYDGIYTDTLLRENYISVESIPYQPDLPAGPSNLCGSYSGTYTTNPAMYADSYDWEVTPSGAGTITGNGISAVFTASATWTGTCNIKVRGSSQCGDGPWSTGAICQVSHNPVQFDLTGEGGYCEGTEGSELILSGSETGVDYELYLDSEPTGAILPGTGAPLNFGYFTEPGIYSSFAFTDFCSEFMVGQIYVHELPVPEQASMPVGPGTGCDGQSASYTTTPMIDADVYIWTLTPVEAGELIPVSDTAHITWNPGYTGTAALSVHGENLCGEGMESELLEINVYIAPTPEILGLELACSDYEEKYETADNSGSFYTWEVTGGMIVDGAGTYQVTILWGAPGDGSVSVTEETAHGCITESETLAVTIEICENITEIPGEKITIYPNPAKDILNVIIETNEGSNAGRINILNSFGQVMDKMDFKQNSDHLQFNISGYPAGVYVIQLKNENDQYLNSRFIVVK